MMQAIDADIRRAAVEDQESIVLQAPAGSGKTSVLVQRMLFLLARVSEPEQILAITFTRKAAAEMRERVLQALAQAAGQEPLPPSADDNQRYSVQLAKAALAHSAAQGWDLARHPGRLRIQTIESLNRWIASQLPATAGLPAGEVAEQPTQLYRDAARRTLLTAAASPEWRATLVSALRGRDNRWQLLELALAEMLPARARWLPILLAQEPAAQVEAINAYLGQTAQVLMQDALVVFGQALLRDTAPVLRATADLRVPAGDTDPDWCAWRDPAAALTADPAQWRCWRLLGRFFLDTKPHDPGLRKVFRTSNGLPAIAPEQRKSGTELLGRLAQTQGSVAMLRHLAALPDPPGSGKECELLLALCQLLPLAAASLQQEMAEQSVGDLVAVAGAARAALVAESAPTELVLRLGETLRHILVDEFQDTSADQFELLENLTQGWSRGDGRSLLLVGDPMQSIYGFRDANVALFLRAQSSGIGGLRLKPLALRANFRSAPDIVAFVNDKFANLLPCEDDLQSGRVSFVPAVASSGIVVPGEVRFHLLPATAKAPATDLETQRVIAIVRELLAKAPDARIAVLTQARTHVAGLAGRLRAAGIGVRGLKMTPLAELPAIQDLVALTRALLDPMDRVAWLAVLRAPWCGASLDALEILTQDSLDRSLAQTLQDCAARGDWPDRAPRLRSVASILLAAIPDLAARPLAEIVERTWCELGGPACLGAETTLRDAENYLDRLGLAAAGKGWRGSRSIASLVDDLYAEPGPDAPIQIMTVHEAKGLQFEHVIFAGLGRKLKVELPPLLICLIEPRATPDLPVCLLATRPAAGDPGRDHSLYRYLTHRLRTRQDDERLRLIYVAATRAIHSLHWVAGLAQDQDGGWKAPHRLSALHRLWPVLGQDFLRGDQGATEKPLPAAEAPEQPLAPRPLWRLPNDWLPPAPQSLDSVERDVLADDSSLEPEFLWAGAESRHAGTVLHAALHRLAESSRLTGELPGSLGVDPGWAGELRVLGVAASRVPKLIEGIAVALDAMLADPIGRWVLDPRHRNASCEMPVTGEIEGKLVSAVIDRYFVDASGTRWIIDYKSGRHLGGDLEEFLANEQRRYASQIERYRNLLAGGAPQRDAAGELRAALYFPMLQRIVYYD